jgi:hypothetical protein
MDSAAHVALENLKGFFVSFPPEQDHKDLAEHHFALHQASLTLCNFSHATSSLDSSMDMFSLRRGTSPQSPKMQRKGRPRSYAGGGKWRHNQENQVPTDVQDATQLEADLLKEMKQILQVNLHLLAFATDGLTSLDLFCSLDETIFPSTCKDSTLTQLGSSHHHDLFKQMLPEQAPFEN